MQRRDAVHVVRSDEGHMAHAHAASVVFPDQRNRGQQPVIARMRGAHSIEVLGVDAVDDLHMARQQPLHQRHRPGFQRLGQQRMIGVGNRAARDGPCFLPGDAVLVHQKAHQLSHRDGGMRVVQLDRYTLGQRMDAAGLADLSAQQVLQRGRGEEVFLPQPQLLSRRAVVRGVEHLRDRFRADLLGQRAMMIAAVKGIEAQRVRRARTP